MKAFLLNHILPPILWVFIHLWCMTLRKKILNPEIENEIPETTGKSILTFWHSHICTFFIIFGDCMSTTCWSAPVRTET